MRPRGTYNDDVCKSEKGRLRLVVTVGEAKDWQAIFTGVKEVRDAVRQFLHRKVLGPDRVIPYDGSRQ